MNKQYEYQTIQLTGPMYDIDLNLQGQAGWHLSAVVIGQSGLYYYTFARLLPQLVIHRLKPEATEADLADAHEHVARASRRDPVVKSPIDPTHQEGE